MKLSSIQVAIVFLAVIIAISITNISLLIYDEGRLSKNIIIEMALILLITTGFYKRHRLIWQWGRILSIFLVLRILLNFYRDRAILSFDINDWGGIFLYTGSIQIVALIAICCSFGYINSRQYFRLVCPQCCSLKVRSKDFFFCKAQCRQCKHIW